MKARKMFNGLVVLALLLPLLLTGDPASTRAAEPLGALNGAEVDDVQEAISSGFPGRWSRWLPAAWMYLSSE